MQIEGAMLGSTDFRGLLDRLRAADQLCDVSVPTDIRYLSTLIDQSDKAILFHDVPGYSMPVVSGLLGSRERLLRSRTAPASFASFSAW